ncbi:MAG TPA: glucodextranase DOMON-like domain-containing protein [Solirubrobacteraceae bacterium]|nr:glucodextranase DOMON-like domain-containing protein [Solirubrobacteraceae bacterium]
MGRRLRSVRAALVGLGIFGALVVPGSASALTAALSHGAAGGTVAPGAPGSLSYFDLARKDCVGTARNTSSKVWFTVADGALSDTYWPTVDATNVHTLQYLVSDGSTFTDLQQRDMTYRVASDPTGMACTVIAKDTAHGYTIRTTYIGDPDRNAVLMRVSFTGPSGDRLYLRLDPLAGGTGGGGSENAGGNSAQLASAKGVSGPIPVAFNTNTTTDATNRSYAVPTYEALEASTGFDQASVGYAGTASDGLSMLDSAHALTTYDSAPDGHVALTAELPVSSGAPPVNVALGFGTTEQAALNTARASVRSDFTAAERQYEAGWDYYDSGLTPPPAFLGAAGAREYTESLNVVKASEDKTFPGAIAAGLASPWGQSVPAGNDTNGAPTYFGSYREVFSRDLYEAASALLVAGDPATAQAATKFLFDRQQLPSGAMPRNSLLNGKPAPDTGGLQLDEVSYPILLDWESGLASNRGLYLHHVVPAADFLVAHGPSDGSERWEEQSGYSPSTIAAEIAGLTAAANIARVNGDPAREDVYQATADDFARNVVSWTVTTNGPYISSSVPAYFLRLSKNADPNSPDPVNLGNGSITVDQRSLIDAGFLELVRLGILPASDPVVQQSLTVVDATIERRTPSGPGFYRYGTSAKGSQDGYGDCYQPSSSSCSVIGAPWPPTDTGTGHLWPVLDGERGEYEIAAGDASRAGSMLTAMRRMTSGVGLEPEQVWEDPNLAPSPYGSDPTTASIGFVDGRPAGSASPLTWAQAQYARLALAIGSGHDLETPRITLQRYVTSGMPGSLPVTVSSPAAGAIVDSSYVRVSGTTTPGATVAVEAAGPAGGTVPVSSTVAAAGSGAWSVRLPVAMGTTTITATATKAGSTGYTQLSIDNTKVPGTTVFTVTDPAGDDNGPGTYQYPTAADFKPGAFDLLGFTVSETATKVYLQTKIANLAATFGSNFGAQLLDIYVHDPAAGTTSTAAPYASRNYTIAPADAWSEYLEAQGFAAPVWQSAAGGSLGTPQLIVDGTAGTATLVVPRATFGSVGSGWTFTLALTGQDGFSPDQARAFTATPGSYTFGVCASGDNAPICSVDPSSVPKVMDTITPSGVSQSTELNPLNGPVALQGVTVGSAG